jgi:hypothetical protein
MAPAEKAVLPRPFASIDPYGPEKAPPGSTIGTGFPQLRRDGTHPDRPTGLTIRI